MLIRAATASVVVSLLSGCLRVRPESLLPSGALDHAERASEYLTGNPREFVVVGDASSFVWPVLLQDLLDTHARVGGVYRVRNEAALDEGLSLWSADDGAPLRALAEDLAHRQGETRVPRVALCQVSLRGIGDARGPVKSEHDMVGAEMGADALERLALELRELGIERVLFATPVFETGAEPELGLERVALERLLARGHAFISAGPDLFGATKRYFPDAYEADRARPNEFGQKLMAEEWYRVLAGPESREEAVEALYAKDFDVEAIEAAHVDRAGSGP